MGRNSKSNAQFLKGKYLWHCLWSSVYATVERTSIGQQLWRANAGRVVVLQLTGETTANGKCVALYSLAYTQIYMVGQKCKLF